MPKDNKPVSLINAAKAFVKTINDNLTHVDYNRVTCIANDYGIYATGEGISQKLIRFTPREDEVLFAQRLAITRSTTPDIVGSCMKPMYKVGRAPATEEMSWENSNDSEKAKKSLNDSLKTFFGNMSLDQYLSSRMVELDTTDPNSFIVVEFDQAEGETVGTPYPFEVNSAEAINFEYQNNILKWLIVQNKIVLLDNKGKQSIGSKYTIYLPEYSILATEIHKTMVPKFRFDNQVIEINGISDSILETELIPGAVYLMTTDEKKKGNRYFSIQVFEHKIPFVPAMRVGCIRDLTTRGRTNVPLIHLAQAYIEKTIKAISEFDLTNVLHVFPQKIQYSDRCAGYMQENESGEEYVESCLNGYTTSGKVCRACNGSGFKIHKSSQDIIQVALPRDIKDIVSLENVLVYKYPPIDLLEFQKKLSLYEYRYLAQRAVYNSEVFSSEDIMTATEKKIDLDSVYDTLKPFADHYSEMKSFIVECVASIINVYDGFRYVHAFPNDFKMKSYTELLNDYKIANENNAPSYIKKALTRDINRKLYIDQPEEILRIETKEKYFPFPGKTDAAIQFLITSDGTSERIKIFYNHFDLIFNDLEFENENFYRLEESKQRELLEAKIDEYVDKVHEDQSTDAAAAFNEPPENDPNQNDPNQVA